ncbi:AAA domain-containing protein [Halobacillus shinanisalinarum]|uniref:AAA domain-containing protein n=1 Tax=Halobacillus shinanisalinarum TaxID=2932258 RepID=A0ABY4GVS1_9BACI|nr:AAA domain-containing protein [Halobacillus shinanisalinarum]UOQ92262.1 AAA domain-containing protein [Halobacillus shinanisalinarum]
MESINTMEKAKNFFEYMLSLNKLVGKVVRDYKEFDKNWDLNELNDLEGCYTFGDCQKEGHVLEIHRPVINERDEKPPKPDKLISRWINFDYNNETSNPSYKVEKVATDDDGNEIKEIFSENSKRKQSYQVWVAEWKEWAANLKEKRTVLRLYEEYFELISRFEKEGEALEFIYGTGLFCWQHPDPKIGTIRSPLITTKLELELDADRGIITANQVDETIKVENEMFSGVQLPNMDQVNELTSSIQASGITEDFSDFYTQFVNLIDANGEYIAEPTNIKPQKHPIIYDYSIFSLRSKNTRVLREDLEQIIEEISSGEEFELSETVLSILGEESDLSKDNAKGFEKDGLNSVEKNLYFPLESNEQQKEIVNRVEHHHGVTVQGPPGTGKTHTIANLVSHFLSEGKKILITSQKESPLKVLKNKIPKEIRDLCVPVLGGGRESLQGIEQSIRTISEKLGEVDVQKLERVIERNKDNLDRSKRNESKLKSQIKEYAEKEGTSIQYKGERLYKYDVAKRLSESTIDYSWIQDDVPLDGKFSLQAPDFKEMWALRGELHKGDLSLVHKELPVVDEQIRNSESFSSFMDGGESLVDSNDVGKNILETYQLPSDETVLEPLLASINATIHVSEILSDNEYQAVIEDFRAGGGREQRWRTLIEETEDAKQQLFEYYNQLVTHKVDLPHKDLSFLREELEIAKERLKTGKKPNFFFFMLKGKSCKYLFEKPVVDGKSVNTLEDIVPLETYLKYEELKQETARKFNGNMEEIGHSIIELEEKRFPYLLEDRLNELKSIQESIDAVISFKEKIADYNLDELDPYSPIDNKKVKAEMETAIEHLKYRKWDQEFYKEHQLLRELSDEEKMHPITEEFTAAFESKDRAKWSDLLTRLQTLQEKQLNVKQFYQLLDPLKPSLPLTRKWIEFSVGKLIDFPEDYKEAFELKKLQTWLDETKDMNVALLKGQIEDEHKEQRRLVREIVSAATWKNQVQSITAREKRALSAWKSYIKRFGQGTGKYAQNHLQDAREEMKTAQSAIPVWIMPVNQVIENFPVTNDKFDVIIFDESSQCDLFSVNVLMRGNKVIVVGDDEQISPQSIGINQEDVYDLTRRYMTGIPNATLFDGNISLYEIAEQTFPKEGKLMLREHFRCVPEIIQYSNDLSYGGEMIPLRLPLEDEKIDPPVHAVKVDEGYNDERNKDINLPEAEAIVGDIGEMIEDPKFDDQTIGVITLQGLKQHRLIENLIREKIGDREFVKRKIICGNPYTLQGDERDIVFLSMVVAPDRNFRALTKSSDKQRFNVAASRAKNQMRLYHSVELERLNPDDLRYKLLSYCKNPTRLNEQVENLEEQCDSPFEIDVLRMILSKGYKVTPQVQVGRYRIDFVIEGLRDRLAVECDGEKWHGPEKFEEDMQRQESLERAGWLFWRVRGREFYFDRTKAMESLWEQLSEMGIEPVYDHSVLS